MTRRSGRRYWIEIAIVYAFLFMMIALSACKSSKNVVVDEKRDITVERNESEVKSLDVKQGAVVDVISGFFAEKSSEGELFIYDTERAYEKDGEMRAPLLVHYIRKDTVKVIGGTEALRTDSLVVEESVSNAEEFVIKDKTKANVEYKTKWGTDKTVFVSVWLIAIVLILFGLIVFVRRI